MKNKSNYLNLFKFELLVFFCTTLLIVFNNYGILLQTTASIFVAAMTITFLLTILTFTGSLSSALFLKRNKLLDILITTGLWGVGFGLLIKASLIPSSEENTGYVVSGIFFLACSLTLLIYFIWKKTRQVQWGKIIKINL